LNQNPKFTSKFWRTLWKHIGSKFKMNTSFWPQTNGYTKRMNLVVQQFLNNYDDKSTKLGGPFGVGWILLQ
jgi:hypothetical protein